MLLAYCGNVIVWRCCDWNRGRIEASRAKIEQVEDEEENESEEDWHTEHRKLVQLEVA